jgi:hypothetical protein
VTRGFGACILVSIILLLLSLFIYYGIVVIYHFPRNKEILRVEIIVRGIKLETGLTFILPIKVSDYHTCNGRISVQLIPKSYPHTYSEPNSCDLVQE